MRTVLTLIAFFIAVVTMAQSDGKIEMKKNFWGVKFYQDGIDLGTPKNVLLTMRKNEPAANEFGSAISNYNATIFFSAVGGFMIGWPIGQSISKKDPQWGLAAGGAVLVAIGYSFERTFTRRAKKAIDMYNNSSTTSYAPRLKVNINCVGVNLVYKF